MTPREVELVEWDERNADHVGRHGLSFRDVDDVLLTGVAIAQKGRKGRYKIVGRNRAEAVLTVVGSYDGARLAFRPITGWPATAAERLMYSKLGRS